MGRGVGGREEERKRGSGREYPQRKREWEREGRAGRGRRWRPGEGAAGGLLRACAQEREKRLAGRGVRVRASA